MYEIIFDKKAKRQFDKLDLAMKKRIVRAIDEKLAINPKEHLIL
jgi:mRNA-degrading endonuclease RelE of RelBE toxin-antitoxin system